MHVKIYFNYLFIIICVIICCLNRNNKQSINDIYDICKNISISDDVYSYKNKNGYDLWKDINISNITVLCNIMKKLGLTKINDKVYLNSIYGKYKYLYQNKHKSFPDTSYSRLTSTYYNRNDILFGTYDFQHFLYSFQHPTVCDDKNYLLIQGWNAGHLSEIHVISSYLKVAIESNRIAIFHPMYKSNVANGNYCNKYPRNWECYLEPLSNCTLSIEDIRKAVIYKNNNQTDRVVILSVTSKYLNSYPNIINLFFKPITFSKVFYKTFWTIQSVTFVFRLNIRTFNYIINTIPLLKEIRNREYMNVWIRHGNKIHEMKLIPTHLYESSITFYYKVWGKKLLYISSDDPEAIKYFSKKYKIKYLKYKRKNDKSPYHALISGDNLTLNVIADLLIAISSSAYSGTLKSNIARIINELRMTVAYRLNSPYFEIGSLKNSVTLIDQI